MSDIQKQLEGVRVEGFSLVVDFPATTRGAMQRGQFEKDLNSLVATELSFSSIGVRIIGEGRSLFVPWSRILYIEEKRNG